ncbi:MAG: MG2 domain-containing protein, partial [Bryobacteraceae bacterium]
MHIFDRLRWTGTTALKLALLLAAAAAGLSQSEDEPYFALSSTRTFASHGRPSVAISAWNVDAVEFRVYRGHDPVQFFKQIEDPHRFGEQSPAPPRGLTLLERIHSWKRSLRAGIRRSLRAQFTESPSAHFESALSRGAAPAANAPKGTHFAEAPLLNSQQMVLSFYQPVKSHSRWDEETVPIGIADKGMYLVEAVRGQLRAYTLLIVSDMVMITKHDNRRVVNLLVDRTSGAPLRGVTVNSMTRDESIEQVESDANGMAELHQPASPGKDLRLVARRGQDFAVASIDAGMLNGGAGQWTGYVYTDRPIYRPGHTVHFKAILREHGSAGYQVPAGQNISVVIQDTDQKAVYRKTLATSATGAIHDDVTLPSNVSLGYYSIQLKAGDEQMDGDFEVQEYKKPEYEVRVQASKPRVIQGDSVSVTFDARYYFGEPVAGAKVKYAIYRSRYWLPLWYDPDEEMSPDTAGDADDDSGDQTAEQDGQLDEDGKLTINLPTTVSDHKYDYRYRIEARVTDAGNREVTGKGYVLATYGSFAVNVEPNRYFYEPGAHGSFQIEARDYDGKPVQSRVHVALLRRPKRKSDSPETVASTDVDLNADGAGTANLDLPAAGGAYQIRVSAKTPEGREVEDNSWLWVEGGGGWQTGSDDDRTVQIVADKKSYAAGDTVKLLIVTGQPNTAVYVSVEGRTLRDCKLLRSTGATVTYEVPVGASDEPGINIAAAFVRKGVFYSGVKYVSVPPVDHRLNVKLATDRPQYLPGQTAQYKIEVTGPDGQPVPRAEFSLGVVDEAIYGLRPDTTRDPLGFFFEREWNRVNNEVSLEYYFNGEAGKRRMRLAELRRPFRLAQLKPERLVQPKIRK